MTEKYYATAPKDLESLYLTPGKRYLMNSIFFDTLEFVFAFRIQSDLPGPEGEIQCNAVRCAHLDGKSWIIEKEPA